MLSFSCPYHHHVSLSYCIIYSLFLSITFVSNLYLLIPRHVRSLPRNHKLHVQWRIISVLFTVGLVLISYPLLFCRHTYSVNNYKNINTNILNILGMTRFSFAPILQILILYLGPLVTLFLRWLKSYNINYKIKIESWCSIRDYIIGPVSEELVFRSCSLPPWLLLSQQKSLSISQICLIVPLFFGLAHVHHFYMKLNSHIKPFSLLLSTIFQFLYTTLFGIYVSYIYIQTASSASIILVHCFCNILGLPNMSFLWEKRYKKNLFSGLEKIIIIMGYSLGITGFVLMFHLDKEEHGLDIFYSKEFQMRKILDI